MRWSRAVIALPAIGLVLAACTGSPDEPSAATRSEEAATEMGGSGTGDTLSAQEAAVLGVDADVVQRVRALCAPGPGRTVTDLADVAIPAVATDATVAAGGRVDSVDVAQVDVPPLAIPATVAEAGCVVTYDAPAGCLPTIEISDAWIPAVAIPGYRVTQPDGEVVDIAGDEEPSQVVPGGRVEQQCQVETAAGTRGVTRAGLLREGLSRPSLSREGVIRRGAGTGEDALPAVSVPSLLVGSVQLPAQSQPAQSLPFRQVVPGVDALGEGDRVSYLAAESVLFEFDKSELLPSAAQTLDAVLQDAQAKGLAGPVRVEGHTDDTGSDGYNQTLSQARARAVADHLVARGISPDRVSVVGLGESAPAHPNDSPENRALNRRVVIEFAGG